MSQLEGQVVFDNETGQMVSAEVQAGRQAWERIKSSGKKLREDWLTLAIALDVGRQLFINEPNYKQRFGEWCQQEGFDDIPTSERSNTLWLFDNKEYLCDPQILCNNPGEIRKEARKIEAEQKRIQNRKDMAEAGKDVVLSDQINIYNGDCLEMINGLTDNSIDCLLTDPPYAVTDNDWDVWNSKDDYIQFMYDWLAALKPKMKDDYHAFIFCDASMTVDIHNLMDECGWDILRQAIWHRPNLAKKRSGSNTFLSSYEPFWHCGTHPLNFPDEWADERFDVQRFTVPQSNHVEDTAVHPTQKPLALFERLVSLGSIEGGLVVEPFLGSGTTAVACKNINRCCVASEQSSEYVDIAKGRLNE